ncbi:hypothetical protein AVEN_26354-1 [Araneus ventricosus]|uniref:Uncharacterized protein n=1 Tax=Araneus ventricosus TaxID=182803 RepID=A0A4Y2S859_ARAVE|nr:hypothetical protein AVEN_26354-1 [Araneus ventricosus]
MSSPVPEFREAHQYWQPLLNNDIIRPKPRRLGDMSSPTAQHMQRTPSRERVFGGSPLRPYEGDAEALGGRTPSKEVLAYPKAKEKSAHNSRFCHLLTVILKLSQFLKKINFPLTCFDVNSFS